MDDTDLRIRNNIYSRFVELGRAPRADEVAADLQSSLEERGSALARGPRGQLRRCPARR
jgi:hypothetical protein